MAKTRRADATKYVRRGLLALTFPFLFWLLQVSWRIDPSIYEAVVRPFADLSAVKGIAIAALIILPLVGSACGLMILQCGSRYRMGTVIGVGGVLLLVLLATSRPS